MNSERDKRLPLSESSMVRHARHCGTNQSATSSRRKSCQRCALFKTRCDLQHPHCSRCQAKGVLCKYLASASADEPEIPDMPIQDVEASPGSVLDFESPGPVTIDNFSYTDVSINAGVTPSHSDTWDHTPTYLPSDQKPVVGAASMEAQATISQWDYSVPDDMVFDGIQELTGAAEDTATMGDGDWLNTLLAPENGHFKMSNTEINKISRVLRTYPAMMARQEQLPPHIHFWQIDQKPIPIPIANCFALTRMWQERIDETDGLVTDTIIREIDRLLSEFKTYNEIDLLATLQVLLIYAIMLFFNPASVSRQQNSSPFNLRQVADRVANTGLFTSAELLHRRPSWEAWILVSAKRRTILALYAFDAVFSDTNNIQRTRRTKLDPMPASASKLLWQAPEAGVWAERYDRWSGRWKLGGFTQVEFSREGGKEVWRYGDASDDRFQMWLEEADEFGAMILVAMESSLPALRKSRLLYNLSGGTLVQPAFETGNRLLLL